MHFMELRHRISTHVGITRDHSIVESLMEQHGIKFQAAWKITTISMASALDHHLFKAVHIRLNTSLDRKKPLYKFMRLTNSPQHMIDTP